MALKVVSKRLPLFLSLLFLFSSSCFAFNITQILSEHEEFSTYTNLLGQTKIADDVNKRQSVTVLVVENAAFKPFTGQSDEVVKNVMSLHVILDYLDKQKLQNLDKKTALLTTLFQSTGQAKDKQGFLNVTVSGDGQVAFGSAVSGAELNAKLVKQVTSQPYNISILQVSSLIAPPGAHGGSNSTTKTPSSSSSSDESESPASQEKSETPAASPPNKKSETPAAKSPEKSETPAASSPNKESSAKSPGQAPKPSASRKSPTPSTADSPNESSPARAEEPSAAQSPTDIAPSDSASSPIGSTPEPSAAGAPGPAADGPAAAAASSIAGVKMCALAVIFAATWSLF